MKVRCKLCGFVPWDFGVTIHYFLHSAFEEIMYVLNFPVCSGISRAAVKVLEKFCALAKFLQSSLMKLVPLPDRNF